LCAEAVFGANDTVVIPVVKRLKGWLIARRNATIAKQTRAGKLTGRPRPGVEWVEVKKSKKSWMMRVQHRPAVLLNSTQLG
jgi:hypothetical protein